jgi:hypothetical protein
VSDSSLSFGARFSLAFAAFFRILSDGIFAARVSYATTNALPAPRASEPAPAPKPEPVKPVIREASPDAALQLLAILQREGRFIDFLEEDVSTFSDADIGAAARVVHTGCKKSLREHITLEPVRTESEESRITIEKGFNASAIRITGNVVGEPPFTGTLRHRGWRVKSIALPKLAEGHDAHIVAPAEVEL